jgi:hypothetical protein
MRWMIVLVWMVWGGVASGQDAAPFEAPPVPMNKEEHRLFRGHEETPYERSWQLRAGMQVMGLFKSGQGQPGIYPSIGFRYRGEGAFVDLHLPGGFGLMDAGQYFLQRELLERERAFDFFRLLNAPPQYSFLEVAHVRLGQIFSRPEDGWGFSAGAVIVADFVVFDALFAEEPPQADGEFEDFLSSDPFVVGPGGFIALSRQWEATGVDWVLEASRDLVNFGSYSPLAGWVIGTELDVKPQLGERVSGFVRVRVSYYSHLPGRYPFTTALTLGVNVGL